MTDPTVINQGNVLQKYVILAKDAKGRAAEQLIATVLDDPNVFVFGELIECPNIAQLEHDEHGKGAWNQLQLLAFGIFEDYIEKRTEVVDLAPNRIRKLQMLSIVSIASNLKLIPYSLLLGKLNLTNVRELEDMVIDCIHHGLFRGKLDQEANQLEIHDAIGRDSRPGDLEAHLSTIKRWSEDTSDLLKVLQERMGAAAASKEQKAITAADHDKRVETAKETARAILEASEKSGMRGRDYDSAEYIEEERKGRMGRPDMMSGAYRQM